MLFWPRKQLSDIARKPPLILIDDRLNARGKMRMALQSGQSGQSSTGDRKTGNAFIQSREGGARFIQPFEV